jgi:type I restriction enzyme, S subunit
MIALEQSRRLKYLVELNDSGVWGDDPGGADDAIVLRSTDIALDGSWAISDPARRAISLRDRRAKTLAEGDLVVVTSSGSAAHLGKTARVSREVAALRPCFSNFVQRLRANEDADSRYLYYLLNSTYGASQLEMLGTTTTGLRNLNGSILGAVSCPVAAVAEQREIANFLDAATARIDAVVAKKRQMIHVLEERRVAVTVAGVANPAWPPVKLTLLARLGSGHTPSRDRPDWWENPTIPWITTGDVAQMRGDRIELIEETKLSISELGLANSAAELHPAGTVVLSRTASVGFSAIMARPMATSQDFATWTCGPRLRPRFLLLCLRVMRAELLGRLAMGSTHKTIYMPDIEGIRVPLPTLEEQDQVVNDVWTRLRPIDATVGAIELQIEFLREHRQALITAAVTGQFDVANGAA